MKRRFVVALVAVVFVWPLIHRVLVAQYGINPWKLGAWAMYTTPVPPVVVVTLAPSGGKPAVLDERTLPVWTRQRLARFRAQRHALGTLRRPDDVGQAILAARPDLAWAVVLVETLRLDPRTALMVSSLDRYTYERGDEGS